MSQTIGVAIATFNGIRHLAPQLDSICAQTLKPDLISISDDCSTDGTAQYLLDFAKRCTIPVALKLNTQRGGVIKNFMLAFEQCDTDYLVYCDQDDVWVKGKMASYARAIELPDVSLVLHRSSIVDENLRSSGQCEPSNIQAGLYTFPHLPDHLWGFGHQMMFSKRTLHAMQAIARSTSPPIAAIGECFDLSLLVAAGMVGNIRFLDDQLTMFRRHQGSVSPAAKVGTFDALPAPKDPRRDKVQAHSQLIKNLLEQMGAERFLPIADAAAQSAYAEHLRRLNNRYELRRTVYAAHSPVRRLRAFARLLTARSYGAATNNKLPLRQLLADGWRSFRGGLHADA